MVKKFGLIFFYSGLMLDRESQGLDLKEVRLSQQAIDVNAQGMSRQFTVQTSTQTLKGMGEIPFNGKLPRQLTIDRFNWRMAL